MFHIVVKMMGHGPNNTVLILIRSTWQSGPEELRKKIRGVFECDIHRHEVQPPEVSPRSFDCVTSCFMLESACSTDEEFNNAISHMASLIKPGGTFITYTSLEATYFKFDGIYFPDYCITDANCCSALKAAELELVHKQIQTVKVDKTVTDCKSEGLFVAKK